VPDYKILHDAWRHVLAYDLRNNGLSSAANGGVTTSGVIPIVPHRPVNTQSQRKVPT
jgi:hypothetical protein